MSLTEVSNFFSFFYAVFESLLQMESGRIIESRREMIHRSWKNMGLIVLKDVTICLRTSEYNISFRKQKTLIIRGMITP